MVLTLLNEDFVSGIYSLKVALLLTRNLIHRQYYSRCSMV